MGFSALGRVAELADALDLGSSGVTRAGSIPVSPTEQLIEGSDRFGDGLGLCFFLSMRLVYASCRIRFVSGFGEFLRGIIFSNQIHQRCLMLLCDM